ncbi:hypothetical protein D9M71_466170 [compost metagenome]
MTNWPSPLAYSTRPPSSLTSYRPLSGLVATLSTGTPSSRDCRVLRIACSALSVAAAKVLTSARAAAAKIWVTRMGTPEGGQGAGCSTPVLKTGCHCGPRCKPPKPTTEAAAVGGVLDRERKAACASGRRLPQLSITVCQQDLICITGDFQKINKSKHIAINVL